MRALLFLVALSSTACLRSTEFKCAASADCSASGAVCEADGYCSFTDPNCTSGRRYGELSGPQAGKCVGGMIDVDGGVDGPMTDGGPGNCPAMYSALNGSAHRYRVISQTSSWSTQKARCPMDGTGIYLAVPDDQNELTALLTAAGVSRVWLGINDPNSNNMFVNAKDGAAFATNSPLWDTSEPDNAAESGGGGGGAPDCVIGAMSTNRLNDEACGRSYAAICECEP